MSSLSVSKFLLILSDSFLEAYVQDPHFKKVYEQLSSSRSKYEILDDFYLHNELLYHFNTLCVPIGERIGLLDKHIFQILQDILVLERYCTI